MFARVVRISHARDKLAGSQGTSTGRWCGSKRSARSWPDSSARTARAFMTPCRRGARRPGCQHAVMLRPVRQKQGRAEFRNVGSYRAVPASAGTAGASALQPCPPLRQHGQVGKQAHKQSCMDHATLRNAQVDAEGRGCAGAKIMMPKQSRCSSLLYTGKVLLGRPAQRSARRGAHVTNAEEGVGRQVWQSQPLQHSGRRYGRD